MWETGEGSEAGEEGGEKERDCHLQFTILHWLQNASL